ncbi:MAG TPA: RNA polymerase sigma factor [Mobilitalea sp.]|nr:RNA polymerase sigma factor [Mobilitalea sp.]
MLLFYLSLMESEGDRNTFTKLYQNYENAMYNIAYSILHDRYLAEDAVNDAFIKLIKYLPDINVIECNKTKALIVIIVKSTAIDIYRKRRKQYEYEIEELGESTEDEEMPLDRVIADEEFHELKQKLKNLKKEYQEIILLKYVYELSNSEISNLMSVSDSVVRQHICRAKKAVKKLIEEKGN